MRPYTAVVRLTICLAVAAALTRTTTADPPAADSDLEATIRRELSRIASIKGVNVEETFISHNEQLQPLFQRFVQAHAGETDGAAIRRFHALLKEAGLTSFDDFRAVMVAPLKYVKDPSSGEQVPVFGPLGSDIINPWMAAVGVAESKPLDEQPMYNLAADVLRQHIDFAIIGTKDPNLSFDGLPPELEQTARWAYERLNPENKFDGGFDHALYYVTIREAAKRLFRQDHPAAKLTMADLVVPVAQGGFGIESCLLCHNRDHAGVYARLVAQSRYHRNRADELRVHRASFSTADATVNSEELNQALSADTMAEMFDLAAKRVLQSASDKIDPQAVEAAMETLSTDHVERLMPGYDEFFATLESIGCTMCHSSAESPEPDTDPAKFNAFVLQPNDYFKAKNIRALLDLVDANDLDESKLLAKAMGKVSHRGEKELTLDEEDALQLRQALHHWMHALDLRSAR